MFYIKYITMYNVHMHAGTMKKLLYMVVRMYERYNPFAKACGLSSVHTHLPYNNLHLMYTISIFMQLLYSEITCFYCICKVFLNNDILYIDTQNIC